MIKNTFFAWLLSSALFLFLLLGFSQSVAAAGYVQGYAWAPNFGWLQFATTSNGTTGVKVTDQGYLEGYAWSSNLGWINFSPTSTISHAPGTAESVHIDSSGNVLGWARACSIFQSGCGGSFRLENQNGGWDGWLEMTNVKLLPAENPLANPVVRRFSGFAWGSLVKGWVDMALQNITGDPTVPPVCVGCGGGGGSGLSCTVDDDNPNAGDIVTYTATVSSLPAPYNYFWNFKNTPVAQTKLITSNNTSVTATTTYSSPGQYQATVNLIGSASATCPIVAVTAQAQCGLTVDIQGTGTVVDNSGRTYTDNVTVNFPCPPTGTVDLTPGPGTNGTTTPLWKNGLCSSTGGDRTLPHHVIGLEAGASKTVCADFGNGDTATQIIVANGFNGTNHVLINNPTSYPAISTPRGATVKVDQGSATIGSINWGDLETIYRSVNNDSICAHPKLLINGLEAGSGTVLGTDPKTIQVELPNKCADPATGASKYHRPFQDYLITINGANVNTKPGKLYLTVNDPTVRPTAR